MSNNQKRMALEWQRRMEALGMQDMCDKSARRKLRYRCWKSSYDTHDTEAMKRLLIKYNADFVVTVEDQILDLPILWSNGQFRVYDGKLDSAEAKAPSSKSPGT